jgi:GTP-binding protein
LGDQFLAHIERCAVLLHLVDGTSATITKDYRTIVKELAAYGAGLEDKPMVLALNKVDALDAKTRKSAMAKLEKASGTRVYAMSGVTGEGVTEVLRALRVDIGADRLRQKPVAVETWRP